MCITDPGRKKKREPRTLLMQTLPLCEHQSEPVAITAGSHSVLLIQAEKWSLALQSPLHPWQLTQTITAASHRLIFRISLKGETHSPNQKSDSVSLQHSETLGQEKGKAQLEIGQDSSHVYRHIVQARRNWYITMKSIRLF